MVPVNPFPNNKILESSELKEFADDNFKSVENSRKFSKWIENTGKRRNCSLRAISPFPTVFSKDFYCRQVKNQSLFGKVLKELHNKKEQKGHDGPVLLHWLIHKIPSYQTLLYLGIGLEKQDSKEGLKLVAIVLMFRNKKISKDFTI